jgi:hypothetical protein
VVNDNRFKRPIAYVTGVRPPTDEELVLMAESDRGIQDYQARTQPTPDTTGHPNASRGFMFIILILAVSGPVILLALKRKNRAA